MDICVHYWDGWVGDQAESLAGVFRSGGTIRLALPDPTNDELVRLIRTRLPNHDEGRIRQGIENTHAKLARIFVDVANTRARLETYFTDKVFWYCGVRCDDRKLVLSLYEHNRGIRIDSPSTLIDLIAHERTRDWFEKEFNDLMDTAARTDVFPPPRQAKK